MKERVKRIAQRKIEMVVEMFKQESPRWVLGLDTLVEIDGEAIHKPDGPEEGPHEREIELL